MQWQIPLYLLPGTSLLSRVLPTPGKLCNCLLLKLLLLEHFLSPCCFCSSYSLSFTFAWSELPWDAAANMALFWLTALFGLNLHSAVWRVWKPHYPPRPICLCRKGSTGWASSRGDISIISSIIRKRHFVWKAFEIFQIILDNWPTLAEPSTQKKHPGMALSPLFLSSVLVPPSSSKTLPGPLGSL